nr:MAG TPA: Small heat shock protein [Caudoviricetes sp.]
MPNLGFLKQNKIMNTNNNTEIVKGDAFYDPFDSLTNKLFSLFDRKGFMPSVFENTSTSYPYDHYMVIDNKTGEIKQQVFEVPIAGYRKNEVHVSVKNDNLKIEIVPEPKDDAPKKYIHKGIKKGKVYFEWYIKGVKPENVKTTIIYGMLIVTVNDCSSSSEYTELEIE